MSVSGTPIFGSIIAVSSERSLTCVKMPDDDGQPHDEECSGSFAAGCLSFITHN